MSKILEGIQLTEKKKKPKPTSPEKWSKAKAKARSKFDVYPSAYANAYAAKEYKKMGGGWRMGESEGDGDSNPMAVAVHRRIMRQNPQWFTKYGVDAIEYAIDEIVGEDWDGEMIYADDVSAYIDQLGQYLRDHYGSREEMDDRRPFAEQGVAEGSRVKEPSGNYRDPHTGRLYSSPDGKDGNDGYRTPEYMLDFYKKKLAQIAAGPYKRTKEVAQLQAKIAKLEKQGVSEGAPELLKQEMPLVRHIEKELEQHGYEKGTEEYKKMFNHALAFYRKFGNIK